MYLFNKTTKMIFFQTVSHINLAIWYWNLAMRQINMVALLIFLTVRLYEDIKDYRSSDSLGHTQWNVF